MVTADRYTPEENQQRVKQWLEGLLWQTIDQINALENYRLKNAAASHGRPNKPVSSGVTGNQGGIDLERDNSSSVTPKTPEVIDLGIKNTFTGNQPGTYTPADATQAVQMRGAVDHRKTTVFKSKFLFDIWSHYKTGNGATKVLQVSDLDFSFVPRNHPLLKNLKPGETQSIDLASIEVNYVSVVLGRVDFKYEGNDEFSVERNLYDFDIKYEQGFSNRNIFTFISGLVHGPVYDNIPLPGNIWGMSFWIDFKGKFKLK